MENQITPFQEKIKGMRAMVESTTVGSAEELAEVSDKIKSVKELGEKIKAEKEKFTAPAKAIIDEARTKYDPYIKECQNAELVLKQKAGKYMTDEAEAIKKQQDAIADKLEAGKIKTETAVKRMEKLPDAPKNITTENSGVQLRKRKVAVIENPELVPDEYWVIDEVRVRKDAMARDKNGLPAIPGVVIKEETSVASL
jgi:hypothetical protein